MRATALAAILLGLAAQAAATPPGGGRVLQAVHASGAIKLDGRLDDPVWPRGARGGGLPAARSRRGQSPRARRPSSASPTTTTRSTSAAACGTASPRRIVRQLSRRDASVEADRFVVYLDPHHDHRTGAQFAVIGGRRPARRAHLQRQLRRLDVGRGVGVGGRARRGRLDGRDAHPASRSCASHAPTGTRGASTSQRIIQRRNEADWLQLVPKNEIGPGVADGAPRGDRRASTPPSTLELLPYVTARAEFIAPKRAGIALQRRLALLAAAPGST